MKGKTINYISIAIGLIVAFYAQAGEDQNVYILVAGIVLLMFGLYNISKTLKPRKEESSFIKTERDDENDI